MLLPEKESYAAICAAFQWRIPQRYNMVQDVCDKHPPNSLALITVDETERETRTTFGTLKQISAQFANVLRGCGANQGDRVGILLPQGLETAVTHLACYRIGAIALPLFTLFGAEALAYRLLDSGATIVVTNQANFPKIEAIRDRLPALKTVILSDGSRGTVNFWDSLAKASSKHKRVETAAEDPAVLIYTSGTTGPPKGALHAHRFMLGHMPSISFYHEFLPQPGDLFWTPADWAWIGGLMDALMPAWFVGLPVLAFAARKFDPEHALYMMAKFHVQNSFLPPTALKLMRQLPNISTRYHLNLRTVFTGGEAMGEALLDWGKSEFGVMINEGYGQTEYNLAVGNCAKIMPVRPGSMGRPIPGHTVEIINDEGMILPPGQSGHIAFKTPHPIAMLRYWNQPEATRKKYVGDWMVSGDQGIKDEAEYLWFQGRTDDVIISAGYRLGPGEIENCLLTHAAVSMSAAVGVPDPIRNQIVKAFIVLNPGYRPSEKLKEEIQLYVKTHLAAHEYPRQIEFVDALPLTATGKIRRNVLREEARQHPFQT